MSQLIEFNEFILFRFFSIAEIGQNTEKTYCFSDIKDKLAKSIIVITTTTC